MCFSLRVVKKMCFSSTNHKLRKLVRFYTISDNNSHNSNEIHDFTKRVCKDTFFARRVIIHYQRYLWNKYQHIPWTLVHYHKLDFPRVGLSLYKFWKNWFQSATKYISTRVLLATASILIEISMEVWAGIEYRL